MHQGRLFWGFQCALTLGFDPWHPKYMYSFAILFVISTPGMGAVASQIFVRISNLCLFYCSPPRHTTNMANVSSIVDLFWSYAYMEGIWMFKPWPNCFFWCCASPFLNATFWNGNMTCWPKCNVCVLEASIWYLRRIVTPWPLIHPLWVWDGRLGGMRCAILVIQPKEKIFMYPTIKSCSL
jgi:hypothetical protein